MNKSQKPGTTGLALACGSSGPTQDLVETEVSIPLFPNNHKAGGCLLLAPPLPRDSYLSKMLFAHHSCLDTIAEFLETLCSQPPSSVRLVA